MRRCVRSHRYVVAKEAETIIADNARPKVFLETGLPARYDLLWVDVRTTSSSSARRCPSARTRAGGQHWHSRIGRQQLVDVAWSLRRPLPEGIPAAEHVSLDPDNVTATVDGVQLQRRAA